MTDGRERAPEPSQRRGIVPKRRPQRRYPEGPGGFASSGDDIDAPSESIRIRTRGLTKRYGELVAVNRLDLDVHAGEIFGLLGQNGAGKTTTILMLLGLSEPSEGQARVVGLDPARHPLEVKRRVGYLPDSVGFYPDLTGREILRYTARLNRLERREAEVAIDGVLAQVGLTHRANDRVEAYSRGMLQRLGIANALLKDPDVLILDEPTAAIDPLGVVEVLELMRALVRERGIAILLSSHLLSQVQSVCDRVGIFAAGRLIGHGTVPQLAERYGGGVARIEVVFEFADPVDAQRTATMLARIEGVVDVTPGERVVDPWTVAVKPAPQEANVRRAIIVLAAREDLPLMSLRPMVASLDEIYRHAVQTLGPSMPGAVV